MIFVIHMFLFKGQLLEVQEKSFLCSFKKKKMSQIKILANDGIHPDGEQLLKDAGYQVDTQKIDQDALPARLPEYDVILVRSATKVRKELIDLCPNLKVVGRGGVGLDNIDVDYAKGKGIQIYNTPAASSHSVAELVFSHIFALSRFIHLSNREMPVRGHEKFKDLKKSYSKGAELNGKTIGIVGFGRIGQAVAKIAFGLGMRVIAVDPYIKKTQLELTFTGYEGMRITLDIKPISMEEMLPQADYISMHVPMLETPAIGKKEIDMMKTGAVIVNAARGGVIDENALLEALDSGKLAGAGLDVFVGEPTPRMDLLNHPRISVSPHIGAATNEAQSNIGKELAEQVITFFNGHS